MANDNSQLKTAYQQGSATVDEKTFKRKQQKFEHKQRSRSRSGSWERSTTPFKPRSKCKRCGFERHITQDGKCPALKSLCGYCNITGHYESACITKRTAKKQGMVQGRDTAVEAQPGDQEITLEEDLQQEHILLPSNRQNR